MATGEFRVRPMPTRRLIGEEALNALRRMGVQRDVTAGTILCRVDEPAAVMYLIESGVVEAFLDRGAPARRIGKGEIVGELALILPDGRRTATLVAAEDCRLLEISRDRFEEFLQAKPDLACQGLRHACAYLVESQRDLVADLRQRNAELEQAVDYLRRTREDLGASEMRASTDELTGLYNRRCLTHQLPRFIERAREEGQGLAAFIIDLDKFKPVNDMHGHAAGDAVLRSVASALRQAVRTTDLPCRLGGDEFAVLVAPVAPMDEAQLAGMVTRIRHDISSVETRLPGVSLRVGATMGAATWKPTDDADSLLARADGYLYAAKEAGRNRASLDGALLSEDRPA